MQERLLNLTMASQKRKAADSEKSTKRRADNWSECEKLTLFQLVSDKVHIIEDKKTDANAVKKKAAAWNEIYDKFVALNITGGSRRTVKQVKEKWKNLKGTSKTEISVYNKETKRTGDGPAREPPSEISHKIKDLIPNEFAQMINPFDDDYVDDAHMSQNIIDNSASDLTI